MRLIKTALSLLIFLNVTGCASMFSGSQQTLVVKTTEGAEIYIDGRYVGTSLIKREVARDMSHEIRVEKDGCENSFRTQSKFNKTSLLGVLVDAGLISIPIDFATGAAWHVWPNKLEIQPICDNS
jgi:hypothetical protein